MIAFDESCAYSSSQYLQPSLYRKTHISPGLDVQSRHIHGLERPQRRWEHPMEHPDPHLPRNMLMDHHVRDGLPAPSMRAFSCVDGANFPSHPHLLVQKRGDSHASSFEVR
jgi:hypothetical protein